MSERNLPIKLILPKASDTISNLPGGKVVFFGDVTPELQKSIIDKFENIRSYYKDIFNENSQIPAVGKIIVKKEAIAKSHKPNDLCKSCPIIGGGDLNEIYIKVTEDGINETIQSISKLGSQKIQANLTTIADIQPIIGQEKIADSLMELAKQNKIADVKSKIKVKLFEFNNEYDDALIYKYVIEKLNTIVVGGSIKEIKYGDNIKLLKVQVRNYEDIQRISEINGVKYVDFFQEYSLPVDEYDETTLKLIEQEEYIECDTVIGIIDGGISDNNRYLSKYILDRREYVAKTYQNHSHATFIASMIQYGNSLNDIYESQKRRFRFVDIIAIPNNDPKCGPIDGIGEEELMEIIEETMEEYAETVKIWNISLGIESLICNEKMSDLGMFLDYIQDEYHVQFLVSSGNLNQAPLRTWPPQATMGERDRIISPADSVRAITVGSLALRESDNSIVKSNEPSPFSRRGPGANYIVKPDVADYGGNYDKNYNINGLGVKGMDPFGNIIEGNGTSYSNPRVTYKYAKIYDELVEKDILLSKAMLIHSARMNSREFLEQSRDNIKYYGFGMPDVDCQDMLLCSENEVTLIFKQQITQGAHLEMFNFPYPNSLIHNGRYFGEIGMTLAYSPILDQKFGKEYCRTNIDVSFGTYKYQLDGKSKFKGQVPLEIAWDGRYERAMVENGFKWSPVKSYYRKFKNGIELADGWKLRIDLSPRNQLIVPPQDFVLIITIKAPDGEDIYTEMINGFRQRGYVMNNLETKLQMRQRQ